MGPTFVLGVRFTQVKLTKVSYMQPTFKVRFIQDFALIRVMLRNVLLYVLT